MLNITKCCRKKERQKDRKTYRQRYIETREMMQKDRETRQICRRTEIQKDREIERQ
jgi:hypothetical protein